MIVAGHETQDCHDWAGRPTFMSELPDIKVGRLGNIMMSCLDLKHLNSLDFES